jgi:hypothetical protein
MEIADFAIEVFVTDPLQISTATLLAVLPYTRQAWVGQNGMEPTLKIRGRKECDRRSN